VIGPLRMLRAASIAQAPPCEFPVLAIEELFAGKIKAMIDRRHPRDLYDLFRFTKSGLNYDPDILRKLAVLFASTMDRDFRTYAIDRISEIDSKDIDRLLYPLLKADDRPDAATMLAGTTPLLAAVLDHTREKDYLASIATGKYQPELLFPKHPAIVEPAFIPHCFGKYKTYPVICHSPSKPNSSFTEPGLLAADKTLAQSALNPETLPWLAPFPQPRSTRLPSEDPFKAGNHPVWNAVTETICVYETRLTLSRPHSSKTQNRSDPSASTSKSRSNNNRSP
jgi:nucleotidyltransferase AbiEii toxin of type IV toxin-antitoxin system